MRELKWHTYPFVKRAVIVHAEQTWRDSVRDDKFDFFTKMEAALQAHGVACYVVKANSQLSCHLRKKNHQHIMVGDLPGRGQNTLHVMPSYIWGFWYVDVAGVHWSSSLRHLHFNPDNIDPTEAEYFFNGVTGHMLRENVSKFSQPARGTLARGAAVIYLQQIEDYKNSSHHLTSEQMIRTTAKMLAGQNVYVKLHPAATQTKWLEELASSLGNVTISTASIHDLSAVSDVVVTQNSAAGFEALMQGKPVITCAEADYHHATITEKTEDQLAEALPIASMAMQGFSYHKYLYWFLRENCLEPQSPDFEKRISALLEL